MFFKHVQQQTSCFIFYLKLDLVLSLIAPLHWHSTLREAAGLQRAAKGKCPGESLETGRNSERVQRGIQRGVHCSKHLRVAASHGSVQEALSSQLVTVLHGNCCKWEHSENGNKNEPFLLSEHSIFGGCGSFRGRQSFKMRFLTGLKGALKAAARLFHWGRAVDLWGRNWNYFKCRVWWKIHDKQFKPLDKIYFIWIHKYRLHWCVCGAPRMGCGFAVLRNGGCVFPHGQRSVEPPCSDCPNSKCEQHKAPAASWLAGVAKCGSSGSLFQLGFWCYCLWHSQWDFSLLIAVSKPSRCPRSISCKAGEWRWVYPAPGARLRERWRREVTKLSSSPPSPALP